MDLFPKKRLQTTEPSAETGGSRSKADAETQGQETAAAAGLTATQSARISADKAAVEFAKPATYERGLLDSGAAKGAIKKNAFAGGEPVYDPYTGQALELRIQDAKLKYGAKWQDHVAEADHVVPLERVYSGHKADPWVKTDDLKTVANDPDNMQVVSRRFNNAKRNRTNEELVTDQQYLDKTGLKLTSKGKKAAIEKDRAVQKTNDAKLRKASVQNALKTGHEAGMASAANAGSTTAIISGVLNITAVIRGEKDVGEALADTAADTAKAAAGGYLMGSGLTVLSHTLTSSSSEFLQALAKSNVPGQVITAVIVTGDTVVRYAKGEIDTRECLIELGEKGLTMVAVHYSMAIGQALIPIPCVGAAVGALVGSLLTSQCYHSLIDLLQTRHLEHEERLRIMAECRQAEAYARRFQAELQMCIDNYFAEYRSCFDDALNQIHSAFENGDADGMIAGANQITRKLGGRVIFDDVEGCRQFLLSGAVDEL